MHSSSSSSSSSNNSDPHIAVLAFPFGTHAAPLLTIIRRLATAAPNTQFSFFTTSTSNTKIFSTSIQNTQGNIKAYDVWDGVPEGYVFSGKPEEAIELFMKTAQESFMKGVKEAVAEMGRRKLSCLVSDAFFWFAAEMAEEMGVHWVPFWTAGPNSLSAHVYTDLIRERIGLGGFEGHENQTLKFIQGMSQIQVRDLPEGVLFGNIESIFSRMLQQMGQMLPQATAVFINSFEELDPITTNDLKTKFNKFLNIGPSNLISPQPTSDTSGCLSWLDKQKAASVAYISFGSVTTPPPNELKVLAEALEAGGVPFIWSLKDMSKVHLPNGFLEKTKVNGMIVPWAPQLDILAHGAVGVFITHCGWNSLLESISGGVPMICRPFFGDQKLNGRVVEDVLEVGLKIEGGIFTKNGVVSSLDLILFQEKGKKMREKMKVLKELAKKAVGPKGSSTRNFESLLQIVSRPKIDAAKE